MQVGDVVVAIERGKALHCGTGWYTHAICTSVEPFILVSEAADMLWVRMQEGNFQALCQAHPDIVERCVRRMERDPSAQMMLKEAWKARRKAGK